MKFSLTDGVSSFSREVERFAPAGQGRVGGSRLFWAAKRGFDIIVSCLALPIVASIALVLAIVNPFLNPGPLLFRQERMGRDGMVFTIVKFRTMLWADTIARGPGDPVEVDRITPLGTWLRQLRIDELPQIVNVLRGEMSLIGPRPDYIVHAAVFAETVPGYRGRHVIRPGISGYAQVNLGYAESVELTARKTQLDNFYIANAGWRLEAAVLLRTLGVLCSGFGAR